MNSSPKMNKSLIVSVALLAVLGLTAAQAATEPSCEGRGESEFFAVPGSCTEVYHCFRGQLTKRNCPSDLWWHAANGYCTYQQDSMCTPGEPAEPETPVTMNCTEAGVNLYPYEGNCSKFFVCTGVGATAMEQSCHPGFFFNADASQCMPEALSNCSNEVGASCPPEDPFTYLPHPVDCASYFMCLSGLKVEMKCKNDLLWNATVNSCDLVEKVTCPV